MSPIQLLSGSQGRGFESRSGPRLLYALDVFEASVKVIEDNGCLHLPSGEEYYNYLRVSMLVSWPNCNCVYLWIVLLSLQKYNKEKRVILKKNQAFHETGSLYVK